MRVLVMGTGGVGGYFGGLLARAGTEVTFVARGEHLAAIRERGLTVRSPRHGEFTVRAPATDAPDGHADVVLFCVKTYDTDAAAVLVRPCLGPDGMVLSLQNGLELTRLTGLFGPRAVAGGVAHIVSHVEGPGLVVHKAGPGRIIFGELDGSISARTERLLAALQQAGADVHLSPQIEGALWEKFLFICGLSGATALTRLPVGPVLASPDARALCQGLMAEVEGVGRAVGVPLPADAVARAMAQAEQFEPWGTSSLATDLKRGRRLEVDSLAGAVVRLGREHGVPTPLNFAVYAALEPYRRGPPALPQPPNGKESMG